MDLGDARKFGQDLGVYCTTAGAKVVPNPEGSRFCAIWIDRRLSLGDDFTAAPTLFMANPPLVTIAGSGFWARCGRKALVLLVLPTE